MSSYLDENGLARVWGKVKDFVNGKFAGDVTIGGQLTDEYGLQSIRSLTQAEFEALTTAEQNNGRFIITDADAPTNTAIWDKIGEDELDVGADLSDAVNIINGNLTDNPTDDDSLQISLDRMGQQRTLTFFRIGWANVKSFINALPATDNPRSDRIYSNTVYKSFNSGGVQKYVGLGFIIIRMNGSTRETTAVTATAYNSSNATETVIADGDQITGELTWFVD